MMGLPRQSSTGWPRSGCRTRRCSSSSGAEGHAGPADGRSRVQDPGSFRLQLNVRDIDAALAGMTAAGSTVVSSNRVPVSMTFGSPARGGWPSRRIRTTCSWSCSSRRRRRSAPRRAQPQAPAPHGAPRRPAAAQAPHQALVGKYCVSCHNSRTRTADLALDALDLGERRREDAAVWEKVIKKVRSGAMPPQGMPQPDDAARAALVVVPRDDARSRGGRHARTPGARRCTG